MAETVIGLIDDYAQARDALHDLENHGFTRDHVSLMTNDTAGVDTSGTANDATTTASGAAVGAATGATVGAVGGGLLGLLAGLGTLMIPGFGPILAAGPILATLTGAGIGAVGGAVIGGLVGALTDLGVPEEEAGVYAEGLRRGGTLLIVQTDTDEMAQAAADIMRRHGVIDIQERGASYRREGWTGFDPNAAPYSTDQMRREQERYREPAVASSSTMTREEERSAIPTQSDAAAGVGTATDESAESDYRSDFQTRYANSGMTYDQLAPAYRFGCDLAGDPRYASSEWNTIEPQARSDWEARGQGAWDPFKGAVRYAWDRARGGFRKVDETGSTSTE